MKSYLIKSIIAFTLLSVAVFGIFILTMVSPYLYTKVHGNEETENLFAVYRIGVDEIPMSSILVYINENSISHIEYDSESMIALHAETEGHAETVLIWYKAEHATSARFVYFF